jgi:hypothetical protein
MRRRFVLLALLLPLAAPAQVPQKRLTFVRDAGRAKVVLAELSKEAGISLDTAPQTENEVIVVAVKDVPLKETLDRIAEAVHGSWKADGNRYRLIRTPEQARAEEQEQWARELQRVRDALERRRKDAPGEFTEAEAKRVATSLREWSKAMMESKEPYRTFGRIHTIDRSGPAGRAMTRILASLDPAVLASLDMEERVVLSNQPTRTQRPLPNGAAVVAQIARDQQTWAEVVQNQPIEPVVRGGTPWYMGSLGSDQKPYASTPKKILFTARKIGAGDFFMQLMLADESGRLMGYANSYLDVASFELQNPPAAPGENDPELTVPPEVVTLGEAIVKRSQAREPLPEPVLAKLARPEETDPMALFVSPLLREAAVKGKANLVACLPDLYFTASYSPQAKMRRDAFVARLDLLGLKITRTDGWWVGQPKEPWWARRVRADRMVLGKVLRSVAANGRASLDDRATLAAKMAPAARNQLPATLLRLVLAPGQEADLREQSLLKFFGTLDASERTRLRQGGTFGSLNPRAQEALQEFVYHLEPQLVVDATKDPGGKISQFVFGGVGRDTTESLPNGIPADARITVTDTESDVLFVSGGVQGNLPYAARTLDAEELALETFMSNNRQYFPYKDWETEPPVPGRFRLGKRRRVEFAFDFTPVLHFNSTLQESGAPQGRELTQDNLPAAFRRLLAERMEALRKQYANTPPPNPVRTNQSTPPPAP